MGALGQYKQLTPDDIPQAYISWHAEKNWIAVALSPQHDLAVLLGGTDYNTALAMESILIMLTNQHYIAYGKAQQVKENPSDPLRASTPNSTST